MFYLQGMIVSKLSLIEKMQFEISLLEPRPEFAGSNGWCSRFCKRYNLKSRRITGSGKSLPNDAAQIAWDYIEGV